jgi:ribosomal protein S18 acetylase RimI-like enzyme
MTDEGTNEEGTETSVEGTTEDVQIRPYDPDRDPQELWDCKRAFELGLGSGTGGDDKQSQYEGKLTDEYAERYLDWVFWCTKHDPRSVQVAEVKTGEVGPDDGAEPELAGYVFVLPQQLAMIWDAAVLNEIFVRPEYRGSGVADDLMDAAVAFAEAQDLPLDRLVLDVDRANDRAQAFYERHGFEHWGEMVARKLD